MQDSPFSAADDSPELASGAAMEALFPHPAAVADVASLAHAEPDLANPEAIDSLFLDPAGPEEAVPGFPSLKAVTASVGLHGIVAGLLLVGFVGAKTPGPVFESPASVMRVSTVRSNPQRAARPQAPSAPSGTAPVSEPPPAPVPAVEPAPPPRNAEAVESAPQTAGTENESPALPQLDSESIGAAVQDYVRNLDSEFTRDWVAECLRYQNRYPTRECPQQMNEEDYSGSADERALVTDVFDALSAAEDAARRRKEMEKESNVLHEMMREDTLLGSMARQRYYLNLEYFDERDPRKFGLRGARPEGDVAGIMSFSLGPGGLRLSILNGLLTVGPEGVERGTPQLNTAPFPSFALPERSEEPAENETAEFRPLPPLFPLR